MLNFLTGRVSFALIMVFVILAVGLGAWAMHLKEENGKSAERIQQLEFEMQNNLKVLALTQKRLDVSEQSRRDFLSHIKRLQDKHVREKKDLEAIISSLHAQEAVLRDKVIKIQTDYPEILNNVQKKQKELTQLQKSMDAQTEAVASQQVQLDHLKIELKSLILEKEDYEKQIDINRAKLASIECLNIIVPELIRGELFRGVRSQSTGVGNH